MQNPQLTYIAIDLKSFYTSVECVDRGLDPLTTDLVVADVNKTEKTICLAVSPSLKQYGIVSIFSAIDVEIFALDAKREKYTAIKQGMMQQLLTGKFRLID